MPSGVSKATWVRWSFSPPPIAKSGGGCAARAPVLFAAGGIWQLATDDKWRGRAERIIALIVDGIRRVGPT